MYLYIFQNIKNIKNCNTNKTPSRRSFLLLGLFFYLVLLYIFIIEVSSLYGTNIFHHCGRKIQMENNVLDKAISFLKYVVLHPKHWDKLNIHEQHMFNEMSSAEQSPIFEFDSKFILLENLQRVNRWALEFGIRKCFLQPGRIGIKHGVTRARLCSIYSINSDKDLLKAYGSREFISIVNYLKTVEQSDRIGELENKFNKEMIRPSIHTIRETPTQPKNIPETKENVVQPPIETNPQPTTSNIYKVTVQVNLADCNLVGIIQGLKSFGVTINPDMKAELNKKIYDEFVMSRLSTFDYVEYICNK